MTDQLALFPEADATTRSGSPAATRSRTPDDDVLLDLDTQENR